MEEVLISEAQVKNEQKNCEQHVAGGHYRRKEFEFVSGITPYNDSPYKNKLVLCGMITGCGIGQLSGVSRFSDKFKDECIE